MVTATHFYDIQGAHSAGTLWNMMLQLFQVRNRDFKLSGRMFALHAVLVLTAILNNSAFYCGKAMCTDLRDLSSKHAIWASMNTAWHGMVCRGDLAV